MSDMVQIVELVGGVRAATDATCASNGEEQSGVEILWSSQLVSQKLIAEKHNTESGSPESGGKGKQNWGREAGP